jgi:hypothetical protein
LYEETRPAPAIATAPDQPPRARRWHRQTHQPSLANRHRNQRRPHTPRPSMPAAARTDPGHTTGTSTQHLDRPQPHPPQHQPKHATQGRHQPRPQPSTGHTWRAGGTGSITSKPEPSGPGTAAPAAALDRPRRARRRHRQTHQRPLTNRTHHRRRPQPLRPSMPPAALDPGHATGTPPAP